MLMLAASLLLIVFSLNKSKPAAQRLLAFCISLSGLLHTIFGSYDPLVGRYEAYAWASMVLVLAYVYKDSLFHKPQPIDLSNPVVAASVSIIIFSASYLSCVFTAITPFTANMIYQQQYQMHRFVTEYYQRPIAVNDIGYVSYQNDHYVLDLWGLASVDALSLRQNRSNTEWIADLTEAHNIKLVMVYDSWFGELPEHWYKLGELERTFGLPVAFYATDCQSYNGILPMLHDFKPTLPDGADFNFNEKTCLSSSSL
jgi:hypothetical protein